MDTCDIYANVNNITTFCSFEVLGTTIKNECAPLCLAAVYYAVNKCAYVYKPAQLYKQLLSIIATCAKKSLS